jgi:hypothetical protein
MVGEICDLVLVTFGGNLGRAVRCLLSRDWLEVDVGTIGLFPTQATPADHPLVAGVGRAVDDVHGEILQVDLTGRPMASWAYLLAADRNRLLVLQAHDDRWREIHRFTTQDCARLASVRAVDRLCPLQAPALPHVHIGSSGAPGRGR